jgi:hypothetical protein
VCSPNKLDLEVQVLRAHPGTFSLGVLGWGLVPGGLLRIPGDSYDRLIA